MNRPRCCAEIGKPGAWRQCTRPAVVRSVREIGAVPGVMLLDYCARHRARAARTDSKITYIVSVVPL